MGTLGAGNHYAEVQAVDQIFDKMAARKMGLDEEGQIVVMIHSGSRGLGHQARELCWEGERRERRKEEKAKSTTVCVHPALVCVMSASGCHRRHDIHGTGHGAR